MPDPRDSLGGEEFDYDDTEEQAPLTGEEPQEPKWNIFRQVPAEETTGSAQEHNVYDVCVKVLKVVAYLLSFVMVLVGCVVAKGTSLFMTSQLKKGKTLEYCDTRSGIGRSWRVDIPEVEMVAWVWCIFLAFIVPEVGTFVRSARICLFKSFKSPALWELATVGFLESLHTVGMALLVFTALPELDSVRALMLTNCVCLLPAVLGLLSRRAEDDGTLTMVVDGLAILCQLCGCVVWPVMEALSEDGNMTLVWSIPVGLILTSFGWWENYVEEREPSGNRRDNPNEGGIFDAVLPGEEEERGSRASLITLLGNIKYRMRRRRYIIYLVVSLWKIALFFGMMVLLMMSRMDNVKLLFTELYDGFASHEMTVNETGGSIQHSYSAAESFSTDFMETKTIWSRARTPAYVWLVQLFAAYVAYITGKFTCKIYIQPFSFALPVSLTVPCSLSLMLLLCGKRADDACCFQDGIPAYLFFECPHGGYINSLLTDYAVWMWVLWMFSQTWITLHIWTPRCERLAATEKLFVSPMYNSILIDQSLALNRRIDDGPDRLIEGLDLDTAMDDKPGNELDEVSEDSDPNSNGSNIHHTDTIPRILGCATMWHEDKNEMLLMLQSVAHIDADQSARRCAQKYLRIVDPDYYLFKTHIFFDDAFEISDDETEEQFVINRFVRTLCESIEEACSNVHGVNIDLPPPTKIPTPYGGRLIYTLPGKTEIVVHLKDKDKIRHRKRWSQVMYLYYLLGYKLMEQDIPTDRKEVIAENTYLLALDGDIDFRPDAMKLLVDLMKKNKMLGAACGRIHPVGSGPMVWYQLFEYAVGHWLQKATEHTIGCVLCSPGCFSLFRARALMDDNVMKTYTTPPTEARHYVQYDQGEDRWLCTLLLQRGYRVEYSAASDAYTHAPEEFNIFYNQRRRWVPSTMANILDLLQSSKRTVRINDNISTLYVAYQVMLMIGSILGPGTIFLMLIGSFNAAFGLSFPMAMVYNAIPVVIFVGSCFFCDSKIQLVLAQLLTAVYTVVMVIVVVGLALQFVQEGLESPTAIFFLATMGSFVVTAMLHPMEFYCLPALVVYYVTVPSMYFLLIVYSFTNMNNVSWGTREVAVKTRKTKKQKKEEVAVIEAAKKQPGGILGFLQQFNNTMKDEDGAVDFSLGNVFRIMCCTTPKGIDEREQLKRIADSIENMNKRMDALEGIGGGARRRTNSRSSLRSTNQMGMLKEANESDPDATSEGSADSDASDEIVMKQRDFLKNPLWMEDSIFSDRRCKTEFLSQHEIEFWQSLIKQYLFPLDENADEKKRIAGELADLRTAVCFSFLMINLLFVVAIFILQLHQDELYINWPLGKTYNIKYTQNAVGSTHMRYHLHLVLTEFVLQILIRVTNLPLEPIGFMFVIFFAIILVIQFVAMLFHRFATISHILSLVSLRSQEDIPNEINKIAKDMQRMKERRESTESTNQMDRRKTIHRLEHEQKSRKITFSLDDNFKQRMEEMESEEVGLGGRDTRMTKRRATIKAAQDRRKSQMLERRKSRASFAASSMLRSRHSSVRAPSTPSTSSQHPASRSSRAGLDNEAYHPSDDEGDDVFQEADSRAKRV